MDAAQFNLAHEPVHRHTLVLSSGVSIKAQGLNSCCDWLGELCQFFESSEVYVRRAIECQTQHINALEQPAREGYRVEVVEHGLLPANMKGCDKS